jgi:hypothetical protein
MSISGIPGFSVPPSLPNNSNAGAARTRTEQRQPVAAQPAAAQAAMTAPAPASVPPQAPPGTDPTLWNVLNAEEREFFAKVGAMGPLTYGRVLTGHMAPPTPAIRGGRLDLKV